MSKVTAGSISGEGSFPHFEVVDISYYFCMMASQWERNTVISVVSVCKGTSSIMRAVPYLWQAPKGLTSQYIMFHRLHTFIEELLAPARL